LVLLWALVFGIWSFAATPPNVLFIVADDLNNDLGCYGHPFVRSPNIDRLAARGVRFDRAYVQYPVCNPSRTSFLSGRRPDTMRVHDLFTPPRTFAKDVVFLPQHFRENGYRTLKVGKIFHTGDAFEDKASWDVDIRETNESKRPPPAQLVTQPNKAAIVLNAPDADTWDGKVARKAVELMEQAVRDGKPFFLGAGFRRPHTPYIAPQKYFDLYPLAKMAWTQEPASHLRDIPLVAFTYAPGRPELPESRRREVMQAYYASVSFMDAQVGVLLDALDRLRLWDNTVVVLFGDHGYHLGEHGGMWHKMSLFEESARVPLLIAAPGKKANVASPRLVETIDLFPTLTELCGLKAPAGLEGKSFVPLLENPVQPWKEAAFTQVIRHRTKRDAQQNVHVLEEKDVLMGYSVRTERWRYIEWDGGQAGAQLYDHDRDPHEFVNLASDPKHAETVTEMKHLLAPVEKWNSR
jgi:uncharacterized sulfatase